MVRTWACDPILANEGKLGGWGSVKVSLSYTWRRRPFFFFALEVALCRCDAWSCVSHRATMRDNAVFGVETSKKLRSLIISLDHCDLLPLRSCSTIILYVDSAFYNLVTLTLVVVL